MRWIIWLPVVALVAWGVWDWGRIRYLLGRSDAFYEITGYLLDEDTAYMDRHAIVTELLEQWGETIPAFTDPKAYKIPKR